jgi:hypothetical protein
MLEGADVMFVLRGSWMEATVEIDATSGLYDWMRKTIQLGPGEAKLVFKNVPINGGGKRIRSPAVTDKLLPGEIALSILDFGGLAPGTAYPALDEVVDARLIEPAP